MIEDWLNVEEIQSVHDTLQRGESYLDFSCMSEIIVDSRLNFGHPDRRKQTHFAVITMCGIWVGKPPDYRAEIRKLRSSFRGINDNETLQEHFRARLTENVLAVENYEQLNFDDFNSIFHPAFPEERRAAMTATAGAGSYFAEEDEDEQEEDKI